MPRTNTIIFALTAGLTAFAANIARADDQIDRIALYKGADRQQMLEDGARKEGTVTLYTAVIVDQVVVPLKAAFERKYPFIEVKYLRNDPEILLQKIMTEYRAGRPLADVTDTGAAQAPLVDAKLIRPFWSPISESWPADHKDPNGFWVTTRYTYHGLAYNTNLVAKGDVPQKFDDLLDPKWKGKMAWSTTILGGPVIITALRHSIGEDKTLDFIKKLSQQNVASIPVANRNITDRVIAGDYALQLDAVLHHPVISALKGAPIAPKAIEPVITLSNAALLLKSPPHPHAAMLFIDFMLSKEGQEVLRNAQYFPASPEVAALPELETIVPNRLGLKQNMIDSEMLIREHAKSSAIFQQYFR